MGGGTASRADPKHAAWSTSWELPRSGNLNCYVRVIGPTLTHTRLFKKGVSAMAAPRAQRADARRNIAAILDAATECLAHDPEMSIADIAAAAGVRRITLYGHFRTCADLVDAVLVRTVQQTHAILDATDTSGDPAEALARLVASSWQLVHQFRNILLAAQRELPAERIRGVHDRIRRRVQSLIEQGQRTGTFRRDMPQQWLITTAYSLMHTAAEDTAAGRPDAGDAADLITATLL